MTRMADQEDACGDVFSIVDPPMRCVRSRGHDKPPQSGEGSTWWNIRVNDPVPEARRWPWQRWRG